MALARHFGPNLLVFKSCLYLSVRSKPFYGSLIHRNGTMYLLSISSLIMCFRVYQHSRVKNQIMSGLIQAKTNPQCLGHWLRIYQSLIMQMHLCVLQCTNKLLLHPLEIPRTNFSKEVSDVVTTSAATEGVPLSTFYVHSDPKSIIPSIPQKQSHLQTCKH